VVVIKSRRMRWVGRVVRIGEGRGVYMVLGLGERDHWGDMCRWGDNIKVDLQEVGCAGMDWIELAQGRDRW
jgi:hypothetical protein